MSLKYYHTVQGALIGETSATLARTDYVSDALGSTVATMDSSAAVTNLYRYSPYGLTTKVSGVGADPVFGWCGSLGYRGSAQFVAMRYIRQRHLSSDLACWTSRDRFFPELAPYGYANANPVNNVDPTGNAAVYFQACAFISGFRSAWPFPKPWMPTLAIGPTGGFVLNTNNRDLFDEPLECKLFTEYRIDSCSVGSDCWQGYADTGISAVGYWVNGHVLDIKENKGGLEFSVQENMYSHCTSYVQFEAKGYAAPFGIHPLAPIVFQIFLQANASHDVVTVEFDVINQTQFPDFEYRVGGNGTVDKWGTISPWLFPELALTLPTIGGPSGSSSFQMPVKRCCHGSC